MSPKMDLSTESALATITSSGRDSNFTASSPTNHGVQVLINAHSFLSNAHLPASSAMSTGAWLRYQNMNSSPLDAVAAAT